MLVRHIQGAFISIFRKILRKLLLFFRKCNFIKTGTYQYEAKKSKANNFQTKLIWQHLFYIKFPFKWYTIYEII